MAEDREMVAAKKATRILELIQDLQSYKLKHPETRVGWRYEPGSILNAYREGDLTFESAVKSLERTAEAPPDRAALLEAAIREAVDMGWCYESREVLWGAIDNDPARITAAMEASAGYVAEATAVLDYVEALEDVLRMADRLFYEAHPKLRKAGNWKLLGVTLERAAATREDYEPEKLRASTGALDLTIGAQDLP